MSTSPNSPNQQNQQNQDKRSDDPSDKQSHKKPDAYPLNKQQGQPTNPPSKSIGWANFAILGIIFLLIGMALGVLAIQQFGDKFFASKSLAEGTKQKSEAIGDQEQTPVLTVEVIKPQTAQVASNITADGTLTAKNTASVSAKVNGLAIESVRVREGQWVNKGDVLATFDTQSLTQNVIQSEAGVKQAQANVKQLEANVVQAKVNLAKSQADLDRVLPLLQIGAVSQQQVDIYRAQLAQNKASLAAARQSVASAKEAVVSAQAQLNNQKINLLDSQLRSPVSGIISAKTAEVGSMPKGSLFTIIEDGRLDWKADVSPEQARKLKVGMPVMVKVSDSQSIQGKVSRLDPVAGTNRQIPVYVSLETNQGVQSGTLLTGEFITGVDAQTILPVSAITSNDGYDYLMAVEHLKQDKDDKGEAISIGRIKRMKVELGRQENNAVIIKTPIPQNLMIVRQGGSFLSQGDVVRVVQAGSK